MLAVASAEVQLVFVSGRAGGLGVLTNESRETGITGITGITVRTEISVFFVPGSTKK